MIKCLNHVFQLVINDEVPAKPKIKDLIERIKKLNSPPKKNFELEENIF